MRKEKVAELLAFYELYYWRHKQVPNSLDLWTAFKFEVSDEEYAEVLAEPKNFKHLYDRHIPLPQDIIPRLTPKQLELISVLTDPSKRLTLSQKLKLVDVTALQYARWLDDTLFAEILYEETNKLTANARDRVLGALVQEATSGNVSAQKLYLELTGEYTPKQQVVGSEAEFKQMTFKLLEVLKKYVDEDTLIKVAIELEQVLFATVNKPKLQRQTLQPTTSFLELE